MSRCISPILLGRGAVNTPILDRQKTGDLRGRLAATSKKNSTSKPFLAKEKLNTSSTSKPVSKSYFFSFLENGSLFVQSGIQTVQKKFFENGPTIKNAPDVNYLRPKDSAYNLKRLSEIDTQNTLSSVCTQEIRNMVPIKNAMHLGYEDPSQYQTICADKAIVTQTAITALSILSITLGKIYICRASNSYPKFYHCVQSTAAFWQGTQGKIVLAVSGALLAASFYAHSQGWLGTQLYDRYLSRREKAIKAVFRDVCKELLMQAETRPHEAQKIAKNILQNKDLIEITLQFDLAISREKAKSLVDELKTACELVLTHHLPPIQTENSFPKKEQSV